MFYFFFKDIAREHCFLKQHLWAGFSVWHIELYVYIHIYIYWSHIVGKKKKLDRKTRDTKERICTSYFLSVPCLVLFLKVFAP